jgi:urease accessory protein
MTQGVGDLSWLRLLQLADSALPIGGLAHSFGLEALVAEADLTEADLAHYFAEWLQGTGRVEAAFCMHAHGVEDDEAWLALNARLSVWKPARESREASLRLGKRFLSLAATLMERPLGASGEVHLATAFGCVAAALQLPSKMAAAAFLHQSLSGAISACQRLLPVGQTTAMRLLWSLKPGMLESVEAAAITPIEELSNLQPMLEVASMRHPHLATRLFIS